MRKQDTVTILLSISNCLSVTDKYEKMVIDMKYTSSQTFFIVRKWFLSMFLADGKQVIPQI